MLAAIFTLSKKNQSNSLVNWYVKKTLNLWSVQIHSLTPNKCLASKKMAKKATHDDMVTSCFLDHIRNKFRCDRRSTLIFFILSSVREKRNHCSDPLSARNFTCMNHDAEFHQWSVDSPTSSVDNIHIVFSYRLCNGHIRFANATASHFRFWER
jgi:hypothetical protein